MAEKRRLSQQQFQAMVIAQDDDNDYEESGYIVVQDGDRFYLANYGHCSCFGTLSALNIEKGYDWDLPADHPYYGGWVDFPSGSWHWEGTQDELVKMAVGRMDPIMPDRPADPDDYDYDHLCNIYKQVLEHFHVTV